MGHPKPAADPEGPFVVVLTQNLKGKATCVWAKVAESYKQALDLARHLTLEKKPPELRCDPDMDSVSIYNLTESPCDDVLTNARCEIWRREAAIYQGTRRKARKDGASDEDDDDTRKIELVGDRGLKIVDFRNDGA